VAPRQRWIYLQTVPGVLRLINKIVHIDQVMLGKCFVRSLRYICVDSISRHRQHKHVFGALRQTTCCISSTSKHYNERTLSTSQKLNGKMDKPAITLNEVEETLRRLLLDVVKFIQNNPVKSTTQSPVNEDLKQAPLELRFTGGWVRDKLLKKESHDIDVAINKMTGYDFGLRLKEYLDVPENLSKYDLQGDTKKPHKLSKITKIDANPDKSKHLETATTKILGLDIDLVNLRKETYTADSRNPQVEFGTPEEDAMRRDATINALFYNIQKSQVEDFTERGLTDLKDGIIRTPMAAYTTFVDDPLRVLRLVRFASRFGYQIDKETLEAMKNSDIKNALMLKISRERVLAELEKMLKGLDPRGSLDLIDSIGLYSCVFVEPLDPDFYTPDLSNWKVTYTTLSHIIAARDEDGGLELRLIALKDKEDEYQAWILASLIPFADSPQISAKKGKKMEHMVARVAREGLKLPAKIVELLSLSMFHLEEIKETVQSKTPKRETLGMAIRNWGATWKLQALFAALYEVFTNPQERNGKSNIAKLFF
jgi:tRNA nucleotidyltransferase (CCA-adding enzyme)